MMYFHGRSIDWSCKEKRKRCTDIKRCKKKPEASLDSQDNRGKTLEEFYQKSAINIVPQQLAGCQD